MRLSIYLLLCFCCFAGTVHARIRNGYEQYVTQTHDAIRQLKQLLDQTDRAADTDRYKIRNTIRGLEESLVYHELTEEALVQLQYISPLIYVEIDNIRDKLDREIDVYVRLTPGNISDIALDGAGFFGQSSSDPHTCMSRRGPNSFCIDVAIRGNSLSVLAHELGHARYIIPNLASYTDYYKRLANYGKRLSLLNSTSLSYLGHSADDPSGRMANAYVRHFMKARRLYINQSGHKPRSITTVLSELRDITKQYDKHHQGVMLTSLYTP